MKNMEVKNLKKLKKTFMKTLLMMKWRKKFKVRVQDQVNKNDYQIEAIKMKTLQKVTVWISNLKFLQIKN